MPPPRNLHRCYAPPAGWKDGAVQLDEEESHHLLRVLRADPGEQLLLFDGVGREAVGRLLAGDSRRAEIAVEEELPAHPLPIDVQLVQALPRQGRMEMILQKATELGATAIQPIMSANTVVQLKGQRARRKEERWRSILIGAAKQCGVALLPELKPIVDFERYLEARKPERPLLICSLEENAIPIKEYVDASAFGAGAALDVLVGPEGDFSEEEYAAAAAAGATPLGLGDLVLRTDTAAFYILSILRFASA